MTEDLIARISRLEALQRSRVPKPSAPSASSSPPERLLPVHSGALPNAILRSGLFGVARRSLHLERHSVPTVAGIELVYTGHRLGQVELDVYLSLLSAYGRSPLGSVCHTNLYRLLRKLGRADSGAARRQLRRQLSRLSASAIDIRLEGLMRYEGSLVDEIYHDELNGGLCVTLNPRLHGLFGRSMWTALNLNTRLSLGDSSLAQWLHGFYSTHENPLPYRVETLHRLCGSENRSIRSFSQELSRALAMVAEASKEEGETFIGEIRSGLVYVQKGNKRRRPVKSHRYARECRV